ncbi:transcriptional repressor [soil metagenome]
MLTQHLNPLTPVEIHQLALKEVPGIGLATVYRSLKSLAADGHVVAVEIPGQAPRYERSDKGHHHHFMCRQCNGVFELETCLDGVKSMAPNGFRVDDHEIILYGICNTCLAKGLGATPSHPACSHPH